MKFKFSSRFLLLFLAQFAWVRSALVDLPSRDKLQNATEHAAHKSAWGSINSPHIDCERSIMVLRRH